jgi:hypothetical protein
LCSFELPLLSYSTDVANANEEGCAKRYKMDDNDSEGLTDPSYEVESENIWKPNYLMSYWTDAITLDPRISVAINLPGGVCIARTDDVEAWIEGGGKLLVVQFFWPDFMTEDLLTSVHTKVYGTEKTHNNLDRQKGFQKSLLTLRGEGNRVSSVARIPLNVAVVDDFVMSCGAYINGARVLMIDMVTPPKVVDVKTKALPLSFGAPAGQPNAP